MIPLNIILTSKRILKNGNTLLLSNDNNTFMYNIASLTNSDMGYLYEKYIGLLFQNNNYNVEYIGLKYGCLDRGIDLIVSDSDETKYLQCKLGKLSIQKIENIMYNASELLVEKYENINKHINKRIISEKPKKIKFFIIIPSKKKCLGKPIENKSFHKKEIYKIEQYFLFKNSMQNKIEGSILEIPFELKDFNECDCK